MPSQQGKDQPSKELAVGVDKKPEITDSDICAEMSAIDSAAVLAANLAEEAEREVGTEPMEGSKEGSAEVEILSKEEAAEVERKRSMPSLAASFKRELKQRKKGDEPHRLPLDDPLYRERRERSREGWERAHNRYAREQDRTEVDKLEARRRKFGSTEVVANVDKTISLKDALKKDLEKKETEKGKPTVPGRSGHRSDSDVSSNLSLSDGEGGTLGRYSRSANGRESGRDAIRLDVRRNRMDRGRGNSGHNRSYRDRNIRERPDRDHNERSARDHKDHRPAHGKSPLHGDRPRRGIEARLTSLAGGDSKPADSSSRSNHHANNRDQKLVIVPPAKSQWDTSSDEEEDTNKKGSIVKSYLRVVKKDPSPVHNKGSSYRDLRHKLNSPTSRKKSPDKSDNTRRKSADSDNTRRKSADRQKPSSRAINMLEIPPAEKPKKKKKRNSSGSLVVDGGGDAPNISSGGKRKLSDGDDAGPKSKRSQSPTFHITINSGKVVTDQDGGYWTILIHSVFFPVFQNDENTGYLLNITFIFDRCLFSLAAVTRVKYEGD